jgi:hypothetical protein
MASRLKAVVKQSCRVAPGGARAFEITIGFA